MATIKPLDALDAAVGLHESIEIIYVVDGYEAILIHEDGAFGMFTGFGSSIQGALEALDAHVEQAQREGHMPIRGRFPDGSRGMAR